MFEEGFYRNGAKYFGKDFDLLKNKKQYKEEYYLNTALWWFRPRSNIEFFTSCICDTRYLYDVIKPPLKSVIIYYYDSLVDIKILKQHYAGENVSFIKIDKNPEPIFNHKTVVFASNNTIIFSKKNLGVKTSLYKNEHVYRDKSTEDFIYYRNLARKLLG